MIADILSPFSARIKRYKVKLSESPIVYRLARGAFWSLIGGVASRAFTLISSIIVARILGREGYGEVGMVQSTIGMFGVFAGFGLGSTATKYIAEFRFKDPEKAGRISNLTMVASLIGGGLMMAACLIMSSWLAGKTLNRPDLTPVLGAGALLLFISTLGGVQLAALSGFEAFRSIARINIWQGVAAPIVAVPCVWFYGVQGAIASFTIIAALGLLLCTIALKHEFEINNIPGKYDRSDWSEWPVLWKYAFPAMLSGLLVAPVAWITNIILVNQPDGYGELGLFNAANQWRMAIIFLPGLLTSAMLPVLSETHGREEKTDFRKTVTLNLRVTWAIAFPLTVLVVTLGKPLAALFGKQFLNAASIITILMVAVFLNIVNSAVGTALASSGRMWTGMVMNLGWAMILIISSLFLIPHFGGCGLAMAYLLAYFIHTLWVMFYVEVKLAPSSISGQWKLILFSLVILIASVLVGNREANQYLYNVLLLLTSTIPLIKLVFSNHHKIFSK